MAVDHFLLPRWFRISRPLDEVPAWEQTRLANWPAIIALLVAVGYGAIASAILPASWNVYDSARNWGPVPLVLADCRGPLRRPRRRHTHSERA